MKKSILWILMVLLGVTSFSKEKIVVYVPSSMTFLQDEIGQDFYEKTGVEAEIVGIKGIPARLKLEKRRPKADIVLGLSEINVIRSHPARDHRQRPASSGRKRI